VGKGKEGVLKGRKKGETPRFRSPRKKGVNLQRYGEKGKKEKKKREKGGEKGENTIPEKERGEGKEGGKKKEEGSGPALSPVAPSSSRALALSGSGKERKKKKRGGEREAHN